MTDQAIPADLIDTNGTNQTQTDQDKKDSSVNESKRRGSLRPLLLLLPFLKPYTPQICLALVSLTVAAGTVLSIGWGLRILIDQGFVNNNPDMLDTALGGLLVAVLVLAAATFGRFFTVSWLGERVMADLRQAVYKHLLSFEPAFFEGNRAGEISSRLTTDTTLIETVIGSSASIALRNAIMFCGGLVLLIISSPKLSGLVAVVVPLVVGTIIIFGRQVKKLSRQSQDKIAEISIHATESLSAVATIQAFVQEAADIVRFGGRVNEAFGASVKRIRARAILTAIVIFFVFGAIGLILWVGGKDVLSGAMSAGELSSFVFYAIIVAGTLGAISEVMGDLNRAAGASERIAELMETQPIITAPDQPVSLPAASAGALAFRHVQFAYPSRPETLSLTDLSLTIKPGEHVAIVGPSGAGKSTLFQLLLRFHDPLAGNVTLDGIDLRDMDPTDFRTRLAVVPQDPVLFATTVKENIRFGRPEASDAEVAAAAEAAAAHTFIQKLSDGYDTELGERGVRLSGGQRQRIAIARAILKDPSVLLLDEATSALDSENETIVQHALEAGMTGRTTLVIAHRLSTVMNADRIIVLDEGKVIDEGTHADLMAKDGLYKRLAEHQFRDAQALDVR